MTTNVNLTPVENAQPREDEKVLLVEPKGYRILVVLYRSQEQSEGGIIIPDEVRDRHDLAQCVGFVVAMGPDCFKDKERWPSGDPLCETGDYVMFRSYAGTRFMLSGSEHEYRILNDDAIEAVVRDPSKIRRVK